MLTKRLEDAALDFHEAILDANAAPVPPIVRADQTNPALFFSFTSVGRPPDDDEPTLPEPDPPWRADWPRKPCFAPEKGQKDVDASRTTTRKPMLLLRLFGLFLLRTAAAALFGLLFHEPPRTTRPGCLTREPRA